ncbi:hypothetical protein MRX96_034861 [Rhipicephalus microplus]
MVAACSCGYELCRIPVSRNSLTSMTPLWPTTARTLHAGNHPTVGSTHGNRSGALLVTLSQRRRCDVRLATAAAPHDEILSFSECALKESLMAVPFSADGKKRFALFRSMPVAFSSPPVHHGLLSR